VCPANKAHVNLQQIDVQTCSKSPPPTWCVRPVSGLSRNARSPGLTPASTSPGLTPAPTRPGGAADSTSPGVAASPAVANRVTAGSSVERSRRQAEDRPRPMSPMTLPAGWVGFVGKSWGLGWVESWFGFGAVWDLGLVWFGWDLGLVG